MCMYSSPVLTELVKEGAKKSSEPVTFWKIFLVHGELDNLQLTGPWSAMVVKPGHTVHPFPSYRYSIQDEALHAFAEKDHAQLFFMMLQNEAVGVDSTRYLNKMRINHSVNWSSQETLARLVLLPISVLPSEIVAVGDHEGGGLNVAISGYVLDQAQYDQAIADVRFRLQHRHERNV